MRRIPILLALLLTLAVAAPAWAQSPALNEAWRQTNALVHAGKYAEAESWAQKAVDLGRSESGEDSGDFAVSVNNLASIYEAQGRYAEADPLYRQVLAILEKALGPDDAYVATALDNLVTLYSDEGRDTDAEPLAKRALAILQKALGPDDPGVATGLNDLAGIYNEEGRYAEAEPLDERALAIREKTLKPGDPKLAVSLNNLAALYGEEGRYADAEPLDRRALAIREQALGPNHPAVAQSLDNLAALYKSQGRYAEAAPLDERALAINEKALGPDHPDVATSLDNLALLDKSLGRYGEAEPLDRRALAIREKALGPDHPDVANSLNNLAALLDAEGRDADAEPLYQRALAIREHALGPDHPEVADSLNSLAARYEKEGRYAIAEPLDKRALAIREQALGPDHPDVANSLNNLAAVYDDEGRRADAEPLYQRALAINEKALGPDHPDVAASLDNLAGLYYEEGRTAEVEPLYRRVLAIDEKALGPDHPDVAQSLNNLAVLYRLQGRYAEAEPLDRRAVAIEAGRAPSNAEESHGRQAELRGARGVFYEEVAVTAHLVAAGAPDAARLREDGFAALQWSKASDTAEAVSHMAARFAAGSDALAALVRARQDSQDRLDAIESTLLQAASRPPAERDAATEDRLRGQADALRPELKRQDDELAAKFPAYAELANPTPIAIAETQKLLAPDEALIAFALDDKESYVALVEHDAYAIDILPVGRQAVSDAVKKLRATLDPDSFSDGVPPFAADTAYTLYQQLLAPAEASLKNVKRLYVVADGALDSLPLGVLLTAKPAAATLAAPDELRAAPWLAKRFAIDVLPSISSLAALRGAARSSPASQPFLGVGDPLLKHHPPAGVVAPAGESIAVARGVAVTAVFRGDGVDGAALRDLPSLPETAGELAAEAKLFGAGADSLLLREAATVTAVKHADLADRRIIAFATHGLLAGDVGVAEPGLVMTPPLSPSAEDDGLLKASEIAQLKLNADLVILSACNTAASDGTPGAEAFSGLAKAFLYAGARSLLVSHWEVASDSTVELMTRLSAHLQTPDIGRAEALRLAMLDVMNDGAHPEFAHPLFWAPFVMVGEGW